MIMNGHLSTADDAELLTFEQTKRAIAEVVESAGDTGISKSDLEAAVEALESLLISAALWQNWEAERVRIGWDGRELTWRVKETDSAATPWPSLAPPPQRRDDLRGLVV